MNHGLIGSDKVTKLTFYEGKTTRSGVQAELRLESGIISLTRLRTGVIEQKTYFSCPIGSVEKMSSFSTVMNVWVDGTVYKLEFGFKAGLRSGAISGISVLFASAAAGARSFKRLRKELEDAGFFWWRDSLIAAGVPVVSAKIAYILMVAGALMILFILLAPK